jgi:aldose sugar dehydrogenase
MMRNTARTLLAATFGLVIAPLGAQQQVPFNNDIPVAPRGLSVPPLPEEPIRYETAEGQDIRVVVLVRGLEHPWSLAFLPDGAMLITERVGRLRVIRDGELHPEPVRGAPEARAVGLSGMLDVALHPEFADNGYVYISYNKGLEGNQSALAVARGRWNGEALEDTRDIFVAGAETGGVSRLVFGRDGLLYVSTFAADEYAQDPASHGKKVLRLNPDGGVPDDNPFVDDPAYAPEIYTLGHRSTLGLAVHPPSGDIWQLEMGPNGGDEINILKPGANYGWPLVSLGRTYPGPWQSEVFQMEGFEDPIVYWMPSISTSGLAFYTGDALPRWKGDVFVGGMRYGQIPGTGRLERILLNQDLEELRREPLLVDLRQRIRDVRQGPDELLYLLTDAEDGALLRIEPAH